MTWPAQWWTVPPKGQASFLAGADPELLRIAIDPLPAAAPASVQYRPGAEGTPGDLVTLVLDAMRRAAVELIRK